METTIETLVEQAKEGDKNALEALIKNIQDRVYGLALRMLRHPADAEDATQEILIKVITHLDSFRQESAFTTWVYRIASNHLLTTRKNRAEQTGMTFTFEHYEELIDMMDSSSVPGDVIPEAEQTLIIEEIMISCMQGMLRCLDRNHRIAYILGEIFEVESEIAGYALNITPTAFRKRLSRARTRIRNFMGKKCGLVNPANPCRCSRHTTIAVETGWVDPDRLLFAKHPRHAPTDMDTVSRPPEMDEFKRVAELFRSHPDYAAPEAFLQNLRDMVDSGKFKLFRQ